MDRPGNRPEYRPEDQPEGRRGTGPTGPSAAESTGRLAEDDTDGPARRVGRRPQVSFEFFPPATIEAAFRLHASLGRLLPLGPRFVSVTYGAGGTTRGLTLEAVKAIARSGTVDVAAHLTCVGASRAQVLAEAERLAEAGVRQVVALRGDPPKGAGRFVPHPEGFASSVELVSALRARGLFDVIRVGAYPEPHPEATRPGQDVDWLKAKFDAGADEAITQFFFEAETFLRFRDACAAAGIDRPIVPGILPIENWQGALRFARRCGAGVPAWLARAFERAERDGEGRVESLAIAAGSELCSQLLDAGVEALHFYTLNRAELTVALCRALGIEPRRGLARVA